MIGDAIFSPCKLYRYVLTRSWVNQPKRIGELGVFGRGDCVFIMLNPSTATADVSDPTVTRCLGFAQRWGFNHLVVLNLFALRSTDPAALYGVDDPVGPDNDRFIRDVTSGAGRVVLAWGAHGLAKERGAKVLRLLPRTCQPLCLGFTKAGAPRHPLYIRNDTEPVSFQ